MNTQVKSDHFFELSTLINSNDYNCVVSAVNQGIDSRLTGFTKSEFKVNNGRLFCWIHTDELEILIRRLLELGNENAEMLADDIVSVQYGIEII